MATRHSLVTTGVPGDHCPETLAQQGEQRYEPGPKRPLRGWERPLLPRHLPFPGLWKNRHSSAFSQRILNGLNGSNQGSLLHLHGQRESMYDRRPTSTSSGGTIHTSAKTLNSRAETIHSLALILNSHRETMHDRRPTSNGPGESIHILALTFHSRRGTIYDPVRSSIGSGGTIHTLALTSTRSCATIQGPALISTSPSETIRLPTATHLLQRRSPPVPGGFVAIVDRIRLRLPRSSCARCLPWRS